MVSPFMAFAKGAFEGYNDIQEEKRLAAAEMALQAQKDAASAVPSRMFQAMGSNGLVNLFPLSAAKDYDVDELLNEDIKLATQYLTKDGRARLNIDSDPVLARNVDMNVENLMQRWFDRNTKREGPDGEITWFPSDFTNTHFYNHDYYGNSWKEVVKNGFVSSYNDVNGNSTLHPDAVLNISQEGDKVQAEPMIINYETMGIIWDRKLKKVVPLNENNFDNIYVPKLNYQRGKAETPTYYRNNFGTTSLRLYAAPVAVSNGQEKEFILREFDQEGAGYITFGDMMRRLVKQRIPDRRLLDVFNNGIKMYNDNAPDDMYKVTNDDIYKAFKLASPPSHILTSHGRTRVSNDADKFIEDTFQIDLAQMKIRAEAGTSGKDTLNFMRTNLTGFEKKHGFFPAIAGVLSPAVSFLAGVGGEAGVVAQAKNFVTSLGVKFGKEIEGTIMTKMETYASLAEAETAGMGGDSIALRGATTSARHDFYKYMLAYQLAVAIQGGTGGRTVSDQDVENMMKAIGDRLFANGRVQVKVLDAIEGFIDNIIEKNRYWGAAKGSIDAAYAADAMDRFMYDGISVNETSTRRTEIMGGVLRAELTKIEDKDLDAAYNGIKDTSLQGILEEATERKTWKGNVSKEYARNDLGFRENLTDYILGGGSIGFTLTRDDYFKVVDQFFHKKSSESETFRTPNMYKKLYLRPMVDVYKGKK